MFLIPWIRTEFLVIIFDHAENRLSTLVWEARGDCCLKSLKEKQIILYSQIFRKKLKLNCIKKRKKIHGILWKSRSRVETITFLHFFCAAYVRCGPRTTFADQGASKTVAFFRIPSKIFMSGTWNFRIIERNIKAIFREYFSVLRQ